MAVVLVRLEQVPLIMLQNQFIQLRQVLDL